MGMSHKKLETLLWLISKAKNLVLTCFKKLEYFNDYTAILFWILNWYVIYFAKSM